LILLILLRYLKYNIISDGKVHLNKTKNIKSKKSYIFSYFYKPKKNIGNMNLKKIQKIAKKSK
jgi:hypothetical protein